MSAPKATEAAVAAVQQALGCIRETWPNDTSPAWCDTHWEEGDEAGSQWAERGCPVAVAAVGAAAPHIAAQTLRGAADEADSIGHHWSGAPALAFFALAGDYRDHADRIEGEP